jgi:hydrogenase expression/formation protein HypE
MMNDLIRQIFLPAFDSPELARMEDSVALSLPGSRIAFSTDSYVVDPLFFPGGDIGELAVNGTVNDLSMSGARPLYLSIGLILEEGFPLESLRRIVLSIRQAAKQAEVVIGAGDTKVVNRGKADKIFINTSGIGLIDGTYTITPKRIEAGDKILLTGCVADHGIAVLSKREGLGLESPIESDTAPLNGLVSSVLGRGGDAVHAMRDPTRGGVASVLNEFAESAQMEIRIHEAAIPLRPAVAGACELLGLDPLYIANEGKFVAAVAPDQAEAVLGAMKAHPLGREAAVIGEVASGRPGLVSMKTAVGGWRIVDMLVGEQLPRIC